MKGENRHLHSESQRERREEKRLGGARRDHASKGLELKAHISRKRLILRDPIDESDEKRRAPCKRIEEEPKRRALALFTAEAVHEEVGRDEHGLPAEEKEEEVAREKTTEDGKEAQKDRGPLKLHGL